MEEQRIQGHTQRQMLSGVSDNDQYDSFVQTNTLAFKKELWTGCFFP